MILLHKFKIYLITIGLLFAIQNAESLRKFRLGRSSHGFLGEPSKLNAIQSNPIDVLDLWFEQPLDHFDESIKSTWKQRYFVNAKYYRNDSNAPIFLMIGGEAEASKRWMNEGAWIRYAQHFGALCFQVEHRYYGKSQPTSDLSTANLKYLTSEQALTDLANFIVKMRQQYNLSDSQKWIAFGGSYPGSLAAWMREIYPQLVHGAISSSGPLLAEVDFKEYFEVVRDSLTSYAPACAKAVQRSFSQVEILMRHMIGQRNLDEKFQTCTPIKDSIENPLDIQNLYENLASNFADVVQYNGDNSPHALIPISVVCDIMMNTTIGVPVERLAAVNALMLKTNKEKCLDYKYDKMIDSMRAESWQSEVAQGMRQWTYQTCNEFGFYQTAENKSDIFGDYFNVNFFIGQCMDIFSKQMDANYLQTAVLKTNGYYGALHPNTTNVLYVHGSIDPWHALGLTASNNPNMPTIYIEGSAHCADMYEPLQSDSQNLVKARNSILKYLAKLLNSLSYKTDLQ